MNPEFPMELNYSQDFDRVFVGSDRVHKDCLLYFRGTESPSARQPVGEGQEAANRELVFR